MTIVNTKKINYKLLVKIESSRRKESSILFPNDVFQTEPYITFTQQVPNLQNVLVHSETTILYKYYK